LPHSPALTTGAVPRTPAPVVIASARNGDEERGLAVPDTHDLTPNVDVLHPISRTKPSRRQINHGPPLPKERTQLTRRGLRLPNHLTTIVDRVRTAIRATERAKIGQHPVTPVISVVAPGHQRVANDLPTVIKVPWLINVKYPMVTEVPEVDQLPTNPDRTTASAGLIKPWIILADNIAPVVDANLT